MRSPRSTPPPGAARVRGAPPPSRPARPSRFLRVRPTVRSTSPPKEPAAVCFDGTMKADPATRETRSGATPAWGATQGHRGHRRLDVRRLPTPTDCSSMGSFPQVADRPGPPPHRRTRSSTATWADYFPEHERDGRSDPRWLADGTGASCFVGGDFKTVNKGGRRQGNFARFGTDAKAGEAGCGRPAVSSTPSRRRST